MQIDYLDELEELLEGSRRYETYIASLCPFHDDSRPSFVVHEDTYNCLSCGAWGKTKNLYAKLSRSTFITPKIKFSFHNPFTGWLNKYTLNELFYVAQKNLPSHYLKNRGIPDIDQKQLDLGLLENWILIPIKNAKDDIIGAIARAGENNPSQSKYITPAGQDPNMIYAPDWALINKSSYIFIVFGIIDAITIYLQGYPAISTVYGKKLDPQYLSEFRKPIYVFPDKREEAEAMRLAKNLGWRGHLIKCNYPDNCKDPNDLLLKDANLLHLTLAGAHG